MNIYHPSFKNCSHCLQDKNISEFSKNKTKKAGVNSICKSCIKIYDENRKISNGEELNRKRRERYKLNKNTLNEKRRNYRETNKEVINKNKREYHKRKMNSDDLYRLKHITRSMVSKAIKRKNFHKTIKTAEILGCDYDTFKIHLESQFDENMSWNNHGTYWDIDHIIPISSAKNKEDIVKLNHYTNLQPLESQYNRYIKKDKILKS